MWRWHREKKIECFVYIVSFIVHDHLAILIDDTRLIVFYKFAVDSADGVCGSGPQILQLCCRCVLTVTIYSVVFKWPDSLKAPPGVGATTLAMQHENPRYSP